MNIQKLSRILHRDGGYFFTVLTMLYAISGVAVNHVGDWNPNYSIETVTVEIDAVKAGDIDGMEQAVMTGLGLSPSEVEGRHKSGPKEFKLFLPNGGEAVIDPATGKGTLKRVKARTVIFEANVLHLNHLKGVWTYVADFFSVSLFLLALTGLLILKGPQGFFGRGKWFFGAGALLPIGFIIYYHLTR